MATPATNFPSAFAPTFTHPWEVIHQVADKGTLPNVFKLTDLASTSLKFAGLFTEISAETFHSFCTTIKYAGKIVQSEGLLCTYATQAIFHPEANPKNAQCYHSRTDGYAGHWYTVPLYIIKIGALTTGATLQTYIIGKKILFPQFCSRVGAQFVQGAGSIAARVGGQNAAAVARSVTNMGASTVKNYCFLVFLTFEAYQGYCRISAADGNKAKAVLEELKCVTNLGKIAALAAITIFNAPVAIVIGVSLVVCVIDLTAIYQKTLMDKVKNQDLINANITKTSEITNLQSQIASLTPLPDGDGDDI